VEFGFVKTTGNTETDSLNLKSAVENERPMWHHHVEFNALRKRDKKVTSAERYFFNAQSNYKISERGYIFGVFTYEDDRFSGFDYIASVAGGYGHKVIDRENMLLKLEGGAGGRESKLEGAEKADDEGIVRGALDFNWDITKTANFSQTLSTEIGSRDSITRSVTALTFQIIGNLAARITYTVKHTSDPPQDKEKTDSETAITLVYKFGQEG
jgi:putative salt-induced outer membrane protein